MEGDLNVLLKNKNEDLQKNGRRPQTNKKWKTTFKKMEDDLKKNGRRPKKKWKTTSSTI